jgi:hypothetical protein
MYELYYSHSCIFEDYLYTLLNDKYGKRTELKNLSGGVFLGLVLQVVLPYPVSCIIRKRKQVASDKQHIQRVNTNCGLSAAIEASSGGKAANQDSSLLCYWKVNLHRRPSILWYHKWFHI